MCETGDRLPGNSTTLRPKVALCRELRIPAPITEQSSDNGTAEDNAYDPSAILTLDASSAVKLIAELQVCNRKDLSAQQRLHTLQKIEPVVSQVLHKLASGFLYFDVPLAPDARKAFNQTAQLTAEMALGYKRSLSESILSPKTLPTEKLDRHQKHRALAQALHYLTISALRHKQVFLDWPTDTWRDANTLMWLAKYESFDRRSITLNDQVTNVQSIYARLCLLAVVSSNKLTPQTYQKVYNTLGSLAAQIQFTPQPNSHLEDNHIYSISGHSQPEIAELSKESKDTRRLFFTAGSILRSLELTAATNRKRQHARTTSQSIVTAEIGLKDIISAMQITNPDDSTIQTLHPLTNNEQQLPNVLTSSEYGVDFLFENVSAGGFSVKTMANAYSRLKVGELFANRYFNENGTALWHVAVIRWIKSGVTKNSDFSTNFGIETLTGNAEPVTINRIKNKQTTQFTIAGLLADYYGTDIKTKVLILPKQKLKTGETISYEDGDGQHLVKLFVSLQESECFQCFALKSIESATYRKADKAVAVSTS